MRSRAKCRALGQGSYGPPAQTALDLPDLLVSPTRAGRAVRAVKNGDGTVTVSGIAVVFDTPGSGQADLSGDFFTAETFLSPTLQRGEEDEFEATYNHGIPSQKALSDLAEHEFTHPVTAKATDTGLLASLILDERDAYEAMLAGLALEGKLSWSSGSAPHRVRRTRHEDGLFEVRRWPIAEIALTPTPCEPRTFAVPLKSLAPAPLSARKAVDFSDGINALRERVQNAAREHLTDPLTGRHPWVWVADVFPEACVLEFDDVEGYRVPLTVGADGAVTFGPREEWVEVERVTDWRPVAKSLDDALRALSPPPASGGPAPGLADLDALNDLLTGPAA